MLKFKELALKRVAILILLLVTTFSFTSCDIIGDIFQAGVWTGIILIVVIVVALIYLFSRFRK